MKPVVEAVGFRGVVEEVSSSRSYVLRGCHISYEDCQPNWLGQTNRILNDVLAGLDPIVELPSETAEDVSKLPKRIS